MVGCHGSCYKSATLVHFGGIPCSVPPSPNVCCLTKPIPIGRWFRDSFLPAIWGTRLEGKGVGIYVHFSVAQTVQSRPGLLIIEASRYTLRHTTIGRTFLDEWSARRRDFYLTTTLTTDIHSPCGIRSRNPSKRAAADPHLRPLFL